MWIGQLADRLGYQVKLQVLEEKPATVEIGISGIYRDAADALLKLIRQETESVALTRKHRLVNPGE